MPSLERRRFLAVATAAGVSVGGFGAASSSATADDDRVEWTADARAEAIALPSPTVVDGVAYVGGTDVMYAFDAESGDEVWSFEGRGTFGTPAVVGDAVYVSTFDGATYALDAESGDEVWRFADSLEGVRSPSVADGTVYVRTNEGDVCAIGAESGEQEWRFAESTGEGSAVAMSALTVVDGAVYVHSRDGIVYAVDAASGEKRWQFDGTFGSYTTPTVADGTVYISSGTVYAVDAETGTETWEASDVGGAVSSPTVADGTVYAGGQLSDTARRPKMYAIDAGSGAVKREYAGAYGAIHAAPTVVDETVFVSTTASGLVGRNGVAAVDAVSGDATWTFTDLEWRPSAPIVVDGTLYVRDHSTVYALDAGVEGSSEDSRVLLGTYNHHRERGFGSEGPLEWLADNWWLPTGTGVLGAGAAYAYSKRTADLDGHR